MLNSWMLECPTTESWPNLNKKHENNVEVFCFLLLLLDKIISSKLLNCVILLLSTCRLILWWDEHWMKCQQPFISIHFSMLQKDLEKWKQQVHDQCRYLRHSLCVQKWEITTATVYQNKKGMCSHPSALHHFLCVNVWGGTIWPPVLQ